MLIDPDYGTGVRHRRQFTGEDGVTGEPYDIMLQLQVATRQTSHWHSVTTGATQSASVDVAEVQAPMWYSVVPTTVAR